jgi:mono/diheme cytochrome c family protein
LPALPDPHGADSLNQRARAYLHTNCSQCHRPNGGTPTPLDLRYDKPLANTNACDAIPQASDLGIADARIIAAGDASRSVLVARMSRRDSFAMPPLASRIVDAAGASLLTDWVDSLAGCN